jgi:acylphosphatase
MIQEIKAIVSGRVQMVMFRDFVQRNAGKLGLVGTVKNMSDGTVLIVAQGDKDKLDKLIEKLHTGSILAKVERVQVKWREPRGEFEGFKIVR